MKLSGKLVGLGAVAVAVVGLVSACSTPSADSRPGGPASSSAATPPPAASPSAKPGAGTIGRTTVGTGGFDIRYLGKDGHVRTLEVKNFPR